jgi:hypothetical protein
MEQLIYQTSPRVIFATNTFVNVPVILQFDDTPLISIVREETLGYTTQIPIYHPDGTYLAKVNGTRIWPTRAGEKAGLAMRQLKGVTVCELDGRPVFEVFHESGDLFRVHAELHTPNGFFVKAASGIDVAQASGQPLVLNGLVLSHNVFHGCQIGVWVRSDGSVSLGGH